MCVYAQILSVWTLLFQEGPADVLRVLAGACFGFAFLCFCLAQGWGRLKPSARTQGELDERRGTREVSLPRALVGSEKWIHLRVL